MVLKATETHHWLTTGPCFSIFNFLNLDNCMVMLYHFLNAGSTLPTLREITPFAFYLRIFSHDQKRFRGTKGMAAALPSPGITWIANVYHVSYNPGQK